MFLLIVAREWPLASGMIATIAQVPAKRQIGGYTGDMVPTGFDEENGVLNPPPGMSPDECEALSVWRGPQENGTPVVISCWKPTAEELAEINRTGRVWLLVLGLTMPPIQPTGHYPFLEE